jgi:hypothetical protein
MSEQCTAPHMFRQQARETRTWAGRRMVLEVVEQHVHGGLDRAGGVGGRGVAVDPALGVNDVGDAGAGAAHGELEAAAVELAAFQVVDERLSTLSLLSTMNSMLLRVVKRRWPSQCLSAISQISRMWVTLMRRAPPHAHGVDLVAGFGHVDQNAGFEDFVIQPFALVFGDDRRVELVVFFRTDVGDPVFHRFVRIVS